MRRIPVLMYEEYNGIVCKRISGREVSYGMNEIVTSMYGQSIHGEIMLWLEGSEMSEMMMMQLFYLF